MDLRHIQPAGNVRVMNGMVNKAETLSVDQVHEQNVRERPIACAWIRPCNRAIRTSMSTVGCRAASTGGLSTGYL